MQSGSWSLVSRSRPNRDVAALSALLFLASAVLVLLAPNVVSPVRSGGWPLTVALALGFAVAQLSVFKYQFRREAIAFSLSEVPVAVSLVFLTPELAVPLRVGVAFLVLLVYRRPGPHKLAFNTSLFAVELATAYAIFYSLIWLWGDSAAAIVPAVFVALVIPSTFSSVLVSLVISRYEGGLATRIASQLHLAWWLFAVNASIGGMVVALSLVSPWLIVVGLIPVGALWGVLKAFGEVDQQLRDLDAVHGFTGRVGRSLNPQEIADAAVSEAARILRCDTAAIVLFDPGDVEVRAVVGNLDVALPSGSGEAMWAAVLQSDRAQLVGVGAGTARLSARGDYVASPILDETGPIGMLLLTGRSQAGGRFVQGDVARVQNLTEQLASSLRRGMLHQRIETEARHDGLTGLPNRTAFERYVIEVLEERDRSGVLFVLMLDLDRFKEVNDTLGHHAGDELLVEFARRMTARLGPNDKMARLAGDEFAIIARRDNYEEMQALANLCLEEASRPVILDGLEIVVTASVGVAELEEHDPDAAGPMRRADIAMYNAKSQRLGVETYRDELDRRTPARLSMLGDLRAAIESSGLHVHYQPKLDLATGTVIGAEALMRWTHPVRGEVPPTDFVRVAEDTGLIKQLTDLMLSNGIGTLRQIHDRGFHLGLSVNLSTHDLLDTRLPDRVAGYLSMHGVDPALLTVEITESSLLSDAPRSRSTITDLNDIGVRMSIDDFGTGYSSLSYLRRLPVAELKIDRSFVANVLIDEQDEVIVRSTIDLGHNLGLQVVAEGVENNEVLEQLRAFGCDVAQGYCISRPLAARHFIAWLNTTVHPSRVQDPLDPVDWPSDSTPTIP
ncbi:MAG: EAL domain-containing protein [Ilumatobacteraceae bacterium]|nr:EAL domain-containing protein [Ilumatobacteraceae bacterium]